MSADSAAATLATSSPDHLAAATEAAITAARAGIEVVKTAGQPAMSTLDAFDEAMSSLTNLGNTADLIAVTHPDGAMREAADAAKQSVAKVATDIKLDRGVFDALSALDVSGDDDATRHYVARTLRDFRRAGVDRDDATRARVRELEEQLVEIAQDFDRNIRTGTLHAAVAPSALDGLPDDYVRAHAPGEDGLVQISTDYPDVVPFLMYSRDGAAREQMWRVFRRRAYPANVEVLQRLLGRRYDLATTLGYPNWAEYAAEDKMIGSASNIADFIERISAASGPRAERDYAQLLARKRVDEPEAAAVRPWDTSYLDNRLKAEQLDLDTQALRQYFEYDRVKTGVMTVLARLFGIRFEPRPDIPVWHPEVECFEVFAGDELIGRIFLDMHPRPGKFTHAAEFSMTVGKAGVRITECSLVCNFPRPGAEPALMEYTNVVTFFHEFGHLIHEVFGGRNRWAGVSGVNTEWDFVEAPSQLLEEWTRDTDVLASFAVHHESGEPLPVEMVAKIRAAQEFGKGMFVRQQMSYATLSYELYASDPATVDPVAVEASATQRRTPFPYVPDTYLYTSFGHLDGYSAVYCTYMWSLVIAKDLFTVFEREGLDSAPAAARYRDRVLAPGGSKPAAELVADFLGRPYEFAAYQAWLDRD